jgi:hypothetical protein
MGLQQTPPKIASPSQPWKALKRVHQRSQGKSDTNGENGIGGGNTRELKKDSFGTSA